MARLKRANNKTMGDAVKEWLRRHPDLGRAG
jgi:hypothetical protein